jgi:hypothetical protein
VSSAMLTEMKHSSAIHYYKQVSFVHKDIQFAKLRRLRERARNILTLLDKVVTNKK